jgi:4-amino-4-deoxy-L-arabinose transferase-like glycosyltransferase
MVESLSRWRAWFMRLAAGHRTALIAALVVLGVVLRLAFGVGYWLGKPLMKDEQEYLLLAVRVAKGQGFNYPPPPESGPPPRHFERPPAFAFFLAGVLTLAQDPLAGDATPGGYEDLPATSSDVPTSVKVAQSLVGGIGILLVAALAGRIAGAAAAVAAAAMACVYPPLAWVCGYVLSEPLYSTLALATVWLLQKAADASGRRLILQGAGAGVLAGVGLLTKEAMLFFLPLAVLWLLYTRAPRLALAMAVGVVSVAGPWIVRNYVVHDRFVLTAAHGGVTLWTGNNPLAAGEGDLAANPEMGKARVALEERYPSATNQDLDDIYYREVFEFVLEHPGRWILLEFRKLFYTFVPIGPSYRLHSDRYYVATLVSYGLLALAALAGLKVLVTHGEPARAWALWLMALSTVIVSLVFFPQERFRIPVMDPTAIVLASVWFGSRR